MAKFSSIEKGTLARKREVPFADLNGRPWVCDLRVLNGTDDREILAAAAADALSQKREAKKGDPAYDFARDVETLLRAAIDSDSPEGAPTAFFKSADMIRDSLDCDRIHYLVAMQAAWQDEHSPLQHDMSDEQYKSKLIELVTSTEGDGGPFDGLAPLLHRRLTRALACQLVRAQMLKSSSSSTTSEPTLSSTPSSAESSA